MIITTNTKELNLDGCPIGKTRVSPNDLINLENLTETELAVLLKVSSFNYPGVIFHLYREPVTDLYFKKSEGMLKAEIQIIPFGTYSSLGSETEKNLDAGFDTQANCLCIHKAIIDNALSVAGNVNYLNQTIYAAVTQRFLKTAKIYEAFYKNPVEVG